MTPKRLDEIRDIVEAGVRGSVVILPALRGAAAELLAALDEYTTAAPDAEADKYLAEQNALAASVGCPVGVDRVAWLVGEVERLRAQLEGR